MILAARADRHPRATKVRVVEVRSIEKLNLPKLADCSSSDAERSELFIVEGDSAVVLPNRTDRTFKRYYHEGKVCPEQAS